MDTNGKMFFSISKLLGMSLFEWFVDYRFVVLSAIVVHMLWSNSLKAAKFVQTEVTWIDELINYAMAPTATTGEHIK